MATTLATLRTAAKQRADMENGGVVATDAEWNSYVNFGYRDLYSMLLDLHEDYYLASVDIPIVANQEDYQVPDGTLYSGAAPFFKLKGMDRIAGSGDKTPQTMFPFQWEERNRFRYYQVYLQPFFTSLYRYRLQGSVYKLIPTPQATTDSVRLWYIPDITLLVNDTDAVVTDTLFDQYISLYAARLALSKEESDLQGINIELAEAKAMVIKTASKRRVDQPKRIAIVQNDYEGLMGGSVGAYGVGSGNPEEQ